MQKMSKVEQTAIDTYKSNFAAFSEKMASCGANILGNGAFGRVFSHPKDKTKVIKIGPSAFFDDGWINYAQLIMSIKNRHISMPNISCFENRKHLGYYVAVMERLQSKYDVDGFKENREFFNNTDYQLHHLSDAIENVFSCNRDRRGDESLIRKTGHGYIIPFLKFLREFRISTGINSDLHSGNIMFRNMTVVVTDPFYHKTDSATTMIKKVIDKRKSSHG